MKTLIFGLLIGLTHISYGQAQFLKDRYNFPIGASINSRLLAENNAYRNVAIAEFTSVTAENHMKMMLVHPEANRFDFSKGDEIVAFAKDHQKRIHGHTLVWHNQVPKWMNEFSGDTQAWEAMLKNHIQTVAKHYKGQVAGWDVVNESFLDDGSLRPTVWSKNIPDYIAKSFQWAHEADPNAILFYNGTIQCNGRCIGIDSCFRIAFQLGEFGGLTRCRHRTSGDNDRLVWTFETLHRAQCH